MHPTDTDIISALAQILSEVAGVDPAEVNSGQAFADDLDLDSLTMVELAIVIEERLGVRIPEEDAGHLVTVGEMAALLQRERAAT
jgi:acyl carrier protein